MTPAVVHDNIENLDLSAERLPHQRISWLRSKKTSGVRTEFLTCVGDIALARHCRPIEGDELLPNKCCRLL